MESEISLWNNAITLKEKTKQPRHSMVNVDEKGEELEREIYTTVKRKRAQNECILHSDALTQQWIQQQQQQQQ